MTPQEPYLIYDGECPFCSRFATMTRLRSSIGTLRLLDAREGGPEVHAAQSAGYDLDDGMVLVLEGATYHGAECLNRLALLSTRSDLFNRLNAWAFRSPMVSRISYPILRFGRNLVLRLLRRSRINATGSETS